MGVVAVTVMVPMLTEEDPRFVRQRETDARMGYSEDLLPE
jgi:hypothetical protein